jgi:hypothetical protein
MLHVKETEKQNFEEKQTIYWKKTGVVIATKVNGHDGV